MGFYIRKSISAGPFRFNLSRSGVGMSVGVKGFRVGSGPRGNYVHMGRGGLYYRASLGGAAQSLDTGRRSQKPALPIQPHPTEDFSMPVETGNILDMVPVKGSDIVRQINEKLGCIRFAPWLLGSGLISSALLLGQDNTQMIGLIVAFSTIILSTLLHHIDTQRKTVVIMYDLDDDVVAPLKTFAQEFDNVASAQRIWNIDTAGRTDDWKRNAGASYLVTRNPAIFGYGVPVVIKTNINLPSIVGGKHSVYFLPDVVLITEGNRVGAISYDEFEVLWNTTVFVEEDCVPPDSQVVGHTWRFVNKNGGPDLRFKNNRQIPQVLYQTMRLQGPGGFQKILYFSRAVDRSKFSAALVGLQGTMRHLEQLALVPPQPRS
jgi:hypothetical protein